MSPDQEPKYGARIVGEDQHIEIFNRKTGIAIPNDEPIFILRGKDVFAACGIRAYSELCRDSAHRDEVMKRLTDFDMFRINKPERIHYPDRGPHGEDMPSGNTVTGEKWPFPTAEYPGRGDTVVPCAEFTSDEK